jgi:aminocarboxymuconate-semialdehyde decarboxylase
MAIAELNRTVKELGFRGVELCTNVRASISPAGLENSLPASGLGVMIFLHPFGTSLVGRMEDHYFLTPLDIRWIPRCASDTSFSSHRTLSRTENLHRPWGGYIPGYWGVSITPSRIARIAASPSKPPSEYLKKLYFDTVVFDERELKHLIEIWGADHIMLGTDYPFDMAEPDPIGLLGRIKGVSKKDMALVAGGNAARLLGLPADA